jgi:hydrogenase maturation protein HypF
MGTQRSEAVFERVVEDLQRLYDVRAALVLHDAHPDYSTTRWARASGLACEPVLHHHAHASALVTEHDCAIEPAIVFAWDGVGFGGDGTLWGGETFVGTAGHWQRRASLRPFHLPGGDRAGREPWRSAAAMCWELDRDCPLPVVDPIVHEAWRRRVNAPQSSAAGRLFDAAAALILGVGTTSFEGQGPMWLEAVAQPVTSWPSLALVEEHDGLIRVDWEPLLSWLLESGGRPAHERAGAVHASLATAIVEVALRLGELHATRVVGLTGGVFQNRRLSELAAAGLEARGFRVLLPRQLPCNDGGLSYGQVADFVGRLQEQTRLPPVVCN